MNWTPLTARGATLRTEIVAVTVLSADGGVRVWGEPFIKGVRIYRSIPVAKAAAEAAIRDKLAQTVAKLKSRGWRVGEGSIICDTPITSVCIEPKAGGLWAVTNPPLFGYADFPSIEEAKAYVVNTFTQLTLTHDQSTYGHKI